MELLTEKIKESTNFQALAKVLTYHYQNQEKRKTIISYNEFEELLTNFIEEIMSNYLNLLSIETKPIFKIEKLIGSLGCQQKEVIKSDEKVIREIYKGDIVNLVYICHELIHFKYWFAIVSGEVNKNIIDVLKEILIRHDGKNRLNYFKYDYYNDNYSLERGEVLANIEGVELLKHILSLMNIELTKKDLEKLNEMYNAMKRKKYIDKRNFTRCPISNNFYNTFNNWFDIIIKDHKEWLDIKQLQIEYYLDEEGNVRKRTTEELLVLQDETENIDIKEYIKNFLVPVNYKSSYDDNFKPKKFDLKISHNKYSKVSNGNK